MVEIQIYVKNTEKDIKKAKNYMRDLVFERYNVKKWILQPEVTESNVEGMACIQGKFEEA